MDLFQPSAKHGAFPSQLYSMKRADVYKAFPELARLINFMDSLVIRDEPGEKESASSALTMPDGGATKAIEDFNYQPMIDEAAKIALDFRKKNTAELSAYLFIYRAVARHIVAMYLHIDQYRNFHKNYDSSKNFLDQNFGLAKESVPEGLETLVLDTEKATRGYGPEDDTVKLLQESKLSFVLAYPDYAAAYCRPDAGPTDVHQLDPVAYMLGGTAERYFKLLHLAVESKLVPLVEAAEAMMNGVPTEKRAEIINRAADRSRDAASVIIKMPELSDPAMYLHLRWFIQGPYNSPSYPNGLTVRGVRIAPGGETGSQSSFAIMSDLVSGVRYNFQEDSLSKMEKIHRTTREQGTINFLDRLWESACKCHADAGVAERHARARLLQSTNYYLLGHSAAYTIHVLAQQKSVVSLQEPDAKRPRKEDVATGGSAGSFLIKKVLERQAYLEKMIESLEGTTHAFSDKESNELFKKQLDAVRRHTEGERDGGLDLTILRKLVGFTETNSVNITPPLS